MELFEKFVTTYFQFALDEILSEIHTLAKHITDSEELWHAVINDAAVGRYAYLTISESIERIDSLVA